MPQNAPNVPKTMPNDANDAQRMPNDAPNDSIFIFARKPVHTHTPEQEWGEEEALKRNNVGLNGEEEDQEDARCLQLRAGTPWMRR